MQIEPGPTAQAIAFIGMAVGWLILGGVYLLLGSTAAWIGLGIWIGAVAFFLIWEFAIPSEDLPEVPGATADRVSRDDPTNLD